mgnify:CR=1 FL=1
MQIGVITKIHENVPEPVPARRRTPYEKPAIRTMAPERSPKRVPVEVG